MMDALLSRLQIERLIWAQPVATVWIVVAAVAVVLLTFLLYSRSRGAPLPVRIALITVRLVALFLALCVLLEPIAMVEQKKEVKGRLPVLIDTSASMAVRDQRKHPQDLVESAVALGMLPASATNNAASALASLTSEQLETVVHASRVELASGILSRSGRPVLDELARDLDIDYYVFGDNLRLLGETGTVDTNVLGSLKADAPGSAILDTLETVSRSGRDAPIAGILLLSDGLETDTRPSEDALSDLGIRNVPVYPVPLGLADPDDVSIRNIIMQEVAFTGDKVPIRVQIHSKGYEKRSVSMLVKLNDREVARRAVDLMGGLQFEDIFFNVDISEKGAAQVEIVIEPRDDEATVANNQVTRSVLIVNEKINVLCIEGSARWEYRYLRAMLKRDPRFQTKFIATHSAAEMARNSDEYIARFPDQREQAFQYDLVILGDVEASFFSGDEMQRLEELVRDRGGSLLMLCGLLASPTSYAGTPVERMLPVTFTPEVEWNTVDEAVHPVLTPQGRGSLVMTLETDPEQNDAIWRRVTPLNRVPPLIQARPGATVLATLSNSANSQDPYPLVAWQRYGTGKCMLVGTDQLWLLRFKTGDKYHWRVWSQLIQFMTLSRLLGEHRRIRLETDRASYPVGAQVQIHAHLLDERYEPVAQSGFDITVTPVDQPGAPPYRMMLRPEAGNSGLYEGFFSPPGPGHYRVEANAGDQDLANSTEFQVADTAPELAQTAMNIEGLRQIAERSGGACLDAAELDRLPQLLNRDRHATQIRTQISLWDNGWILILLVGLFGLEWIVRRSYDLP